MLRWALPKHHVAKSLTRPKLTLLHMPLAEQAQMLVALRRACYGSLRAGAAPWRFTSGGDGARDGPLAAALR